MEKYGEAISIAKSEAEKKLIYEKYIQNQRFLELRTRRIAG